MAAASAATLPAEAHPLATGWGWVAAVPLQLRHACLLECLSFLSACPVFPLACLPMTLPACLLCGQPTHGFSAHLPAQRAGSSPPPARGVTGLLLLLWCAALQDLVSVNITDCSFHGNAATGYAGGAVAVLGTLPVDASVNIDGSTFKENSVGRPPLPLRTQPPRSCFFSMYFFNTNNSRRTRKCLCTECQLITFDVEAAVQRLSLHKLACTKLSIWESISASGRQLLLVCRPAQSSQRHSVACLSKCLLSCQVSGTRQVPGPGFSVYPRK
jgi:hypothetical protein